MVLQGVNDPCVLQAESDDLVAAVRKNEALAEYVVFADEGCGLTRKPNQIEGYGKVLEFLDTHLKRQAATLEPLPWQLQPVDNGWQQASDQRALVDPGSNGVCSCSSVIRAPAMHRSWHCHQGLKPCFSGA